MLSRGRRWEEKEEPVAAAGRERDRRGEVVSAADNGCEDRGSREKEDKTRGRKKKRIKSLLCTTHVVVVVLEISLL